MRWLPVLKSSAKTEKSFSSSTRVKVSVSMFLTFVAHFTNSARFERKSDSLMIPYFPNEVLCFFELFNFFFNLFNLRFFKARFDLLSEEDVECEASSEASDKPPHRSQSRSAKRASAFKMRFLFCDPF